MSELKDLTGCAVGLPDGNQTMALKEGSVRLGKYMKSKKVLYVPNLNCNLISVSQLLDELNCNVLFTKKLCVIQDRTSRMVIGAGERREGLYYLKSMGEIKACNTKYRDINGLWHRRMGHQSAKNSRITS